MFFNSLPFIFIFLPAIVIIYFLLVNSGSRRGQLFLVGASLFFYFLLTPQYLPLLLVSIGFNFLVGTVLIKCKSKSKYQDKILCILWIGILVDFLLLGYYKYFSFVIGNFEQLGFIIPIPDIILPLGISFFTFTQVAFLVDTYRGKVERVDIISYAQFVTFFPHLIAGPIYHHADIIPQFCDREKFVINWTNINLGLFFFFFGLAKKVIIADTLATVASPIFSVIANGLTPMFIEAWVGALAFTLQLYFDFSGYSDMAIGIALLFNIRFPLNFYSPYKVTSIIDFWRCWHITLSNWLRDYLYIPLGGNRYGFPIQVKSILITFLLGGLWHGAGWTFVVWGGLHGIYLVINHLWRKTGIILHSSLCWLITFFAVVIGWVFFRANSIGDAIVMLKGMAGLYGISIPTFLPTFGFFIHQGLWIAPINTPVAILSIGIGMGICLLLPNLCEMTREYPAAITNKNQELIKKIDIFRIRIFYKETIFWAIILGFVTVFAIISVDTTSEFLYFQF